MIRIYQLFDVLSDHRSLVTFQGAIDFKFGVISGPYQLELGVLSGFFQGAFNFKFGVLSGR